MELLLALVIAATLLWSLKSGRAFTGLRMVDRVEHPFGFRVIILAYAVLALAMLAIYLTGL
ncbi:MAG TPA: hypothetical protein VGC35_04055 [Allosphingosinicella sp.]|jgi:hypothetical protein